ncbi:hypothetical protein [Limimaricola cinnabarinus]|jgi:hypothetical protein|uniref:hypothetical protein n=1 Tax=Limimaricola cinnabarinus TaxID=1125964 RepID=UPI0013A64AA2|nr:hypothetical protein [Limimaricola cinnabarinus]
MPKNTAPKQLTRRLAKAGRAILEGLADALLPQPRPQHRPIPIPVSGQRRR